MPSPEQRGHARLRYPAPNRSGLQLDDQSLDLLDLSETGLRFREAESSAHAILGGDVRAVVWLRNGQKVPVAGTVVRVDHGEVAVRLDKAGIPLFNIEAEQSFLRRGRTGLLW